MDSPTTSDAKDAQTRIRTRLEEWTAAIRAKDIDGIMACMTPGVLNFDCHSALQFKGADAYRAFLEACFPHMQGAVTCDMHELSITAGNDVGFCHYIVRVIAQGSDGTEHASWLRATAGLRKIDGEWLVAHAHLSAPFDPMTEKVMLDLAP